MGEPALLAAVFLAALEDLTVAEPMLALQKALLSSDIWVLLENFLWSLLLSSVSAGRWLLVFGLGYHSVLSQLQRCHCIPACLLTDCHGWVQLIEVKDDSVCVQNSIFKKSLHFFGRPNCMLKVSNGNLQPNLHEASRNV